MKHTALFDSDLSELFGDCAETVTLKHGGKSHRLEAIVSPATATDGGFLAVDSGAATASATFRLRSLPSIPICGDYVFTESAAFRVISVDTQGGDASIVCGLEMEGQA